LIPSSFGDGSAPVVVSSAALLPMEGMRLRSMEVAARSVTILVFYLSSKMAWATSHFLRMK